MNKVGVVSTGQGILGRYCKTRAEYLRQELGKRVPQVGTVDTEQYSQVGTSEKHR